MEDENPPQSEEENSDLPVYQVIEGQLVRKLGNRRDPDRSYGQVCDVAAGKTYLREFTDEEVEIRRLEQERWIAESPVREAAEIEKQAAFSRFKSTLVYEQRIVAFLDILGWRDAVDRSARDADLATRLGVALASIQNQVQHTDQAREILPPGVFFDLRATQFSDSIVVSLSANDLVRAEMHLTGILHSLLWNLQNAGLFVRGGITAGPMIHQGSLAYGPALTQAFDLEQQQAIHPRIILSDELVQAWGGGIPVVDREGRLLEVWREWRRDPVDGRFFYDFLGPWPRGSIGALFDARLKQARILIEQSLNEITSYRVRNKYLWLGRYFNEVCLECPRESIDILVL